MRTMGRIALVTAALGLAASIAGAQSVVAAESQPSYGAPTESAFTATVPGLERQAYFWLSSDEVRALRNVAPVSVLVLKWKKHVEILRGTGSPEDNSGFLVVGPDYYSLETAGGETRICDLVLRRIFVFVPGQRGYTNQNLFGLIDLFSMESFNRAVMGTVAEKIPSLAVPAFEQALFEASLGVRARNLPPLATTVSTAGDRVSIRFKNEDIATFRFAREPLAPDYRGVLAKAIRGLYPIHPAAFDAISPLQHLPLEISTVHEQHGSAKARTTVTFELVGTKVLPYPLPSGLSAEASYSGFTSFNVRFINRATELALAAINGTGGRKRPTMNDYAADAERAFRAGDRLGTGLAWLAASLHYPDQAKACDQSTTAGFCIAYREQMRAANDDPRFRRVIEASISCSRGENERGARALASLDVSAETHGYVASMILSCLLIGLPPTKAKGIGGLGTIYPATAFDNAIKAIEGNPYIPSYYRDIGQWFAARYENNVAWRFFDIGRALGGGVKGDAFDMFVAPRERELLSLYPEYF